VQAAGRFDSAQSVRHLTSVSASIVRLRILDGKRSLVIPEEHVILAARVYFPGVFEPAEQQYSFSRLNLALSQILRGKNPPKLMWLSYHSGLPKITPATAQH